MKYAAGFTGKELTCKFGLIKVNYLTLFHVNSDNYSI